MKKNKVTIVIPIYNADKYLAECLDSVISQTYKNLEIILVNDGSKDNSEKIALEYAKNNKRIIYIYQNNSGVSSARNLGISKSSGEYICFIDSDDYICKDFIYNLVDDMEKYSVDITTTATTTKECLIDDNIVEKVEVVDSDDALVRLYYGRLERSENGVQLFTTKLLKDNNITFDISNSICEDFVFLVKALTCSNQIAIDYRIMYYYRLNPCSAMHQKMNVNFFKSISYKSEVGLAVVDNYYGLFDAINVDLFSSSMSIAVRAYSERKEWHKEFRQIWRNIDLHKWSTLNNKNAKFKYRIAALLYCLFGNSIATKLLGIIKK